VIDLLELDGTHFAVLDLEASALGYRSYPIEVGLALMLDVCQPIRTWSMLIRPTEEWLKGGAWSQESAAVHGISRETLLREGQPVQQVCDRLNALLTGISIIVTDAPRHDQDWLDTLFRAGAREQRFAIFDFDALTGGLSRDQYRHMVNLLESRPVPHHAMEDAVRLASALLEAHLGYPPLIKPLKR
jgi:DNA polymerase III epsilon subunit-like protein